MNIFRGAHPASARAPVMVWIHGGGLFDGESNDYDPGKLAEAGIVVVTFNYRLGVLGFLAQPALDREGRHGANYGLMDQQAVLRWVHRNIAKFGGDPRNVTIFGESAGGASVYAHMAAPGSAGLFQKSIAQSGGYAPELPSLADAQKTGTAFAAAAGCADQSANCLRRLSVRRILTVQRPYELGLIIDGVTLLRSLDTAFSTGQFNHVPLLSGTNGDEGGWFVAVAETHYGTPLTRGEFAAAMREIYGRDSQEVMARYPAATYSSASAALSAAETASMFDCPGYRINHAIARFVPTYLYEFDDAQAPGYMASPGFELGAAHTFELQYLFSGFHGAAGIARPLSADQLRLADMMVRYWTMFARTGDPNPPHGTLPAWPRYTAGSARVLSLTLPAPRIIEDYFRTHDCGFWNHLAPPH